MKKWLMMIMVVLLSAMTVNATSISDFRKSNLMALPPFERACVLIRHYETLHKPKHWPTIAYGHVVQKGENYKKRQYTHAEADRILRKDLSRLCAYYRGYGADSLLLACLAYNVGSGRIQNSTLLKKLKSGTVTSITNTPRSRNTKVADIPVSTVADGWNLNYSTDRE